MIAVIGTALALTVTCVTASTSLCNTPLYTFRIEQASSKMNFLPTAMKEFTYTTEKGYNLTYDTLGECYVEPLATRPVDTCFETCNTCETCGLTCATCPGQMTCEYTCPLTCNPTCNQLTCSDTCGRTCVSTCSTCILC